MRPSTVIIDNGTGFTKMGYSGNDFPTYTIPSAIANLAATTKIHNRSTYDQVNYFIGDAAYQNSGSHVMANLLESGEIQDFQHMEKYWNRCFFDYLRCEPQEHNVVLTEPPMNSPENRETIAEIMFETFNVKGLHISVQACLALYGNWYDEQQAGTSHLQGLSGCVVDSGDGVTHIIPVAEGCVIGSCIKHIPIAGKDITRYIMYALRDRKEPIGQDDLMAVAKELKDTHCYVCDDPTTEYEKFDERVRKYSNTEPEKCFREFKPKRLDKKGIVVSKGYETFMGPEIFFRPQLVDGKWNKGIHTHVDDMIQMCPIDIRRNLYSQIVLSGGSTAMSGLQERMESEITRIVRERQAANQMKTGHKALDVQVKVHKNEREANSVFYGASKMASKPEFEKAVHTREDYWEKGSAIFRSNQVYL